MYSATEGLMEGGSSTWVRSSNVGGEATMLSNFGIFSPLVLLEVKVSTLRTKQHKKIIAIYYLFSIYQSNKLNANVYFLI